jgi:hypothetical protein
MSRFNKCATTVCFCLAVLLPWGLPAQQVPARSVKIPDGTVVKLALSAALNSATNEVNDQVLFNAVEDLKVGDVIVIPKGSTGVGHVVDVEKKKRLGRGGKLDFAVDYVKAFDGSNVRLRASSTARGKEKTGTVIATTVLVSPLFLLMHGKDVKVPAGTQFSAYVDGDREIALAPAPSAAPPAQAAAQPAAVAPEELSTLVVKSTPDGADITMDGKFVGSTPSTLRLAPGDHTIAVAKAGFKGWQRTMTVNPGGIVTIDATLEKAE